MRLSDGDAGDSYRELLVTPNALGAAGISYYRIKATIANDDGQAPTVLSAEFAVRMQPLDAQGLPANPLTLTTNDVYVDYQPTPDGEEGVNSHRARRSTGPAGREPAQSPNDKTGEPS